ncbi:MAG: hypothetical protein O7E52_02940 [Candidatus Poribacteria bacterium]|nr:hypothetical protein [Candidatus Poribacteria bacterium]
MIGIILTTYGNLASAFLDAVAGILGSQELVEAVDVMPRDGEREISEHLIEAVSRVRQADGVLILTGLCGESDFNICLSLFANQSVRVVTGLNLPMLFKALTYRSKLNLSDLATCASEGGKFGIIAC